SDRGVSFTAQCPAHGDRTPSLTVATGDGGSALLDCKAGCPIEDVLAELGLDFPDLFSPESRTPPGFGSRELPRGHSPRRYGRSRENSPVAVAEAEASGR